MRDRLSVLSGYMHSPAITPMRVPDCRSKRFTLRYVIFWLLVPVMCLAQAGFASPVRLASGNAAVLRAARETSLRPVLRHASRASGRERLRHAASYVPERTGRGFAHLVRRGNTHHPHTAARLRHARHHGTAAVQQAAREAQLDSAQSQETANESQQTAQLHLPASPELVMNLPPLRGSRESLMRQNQRAEAEGLARIRDDADIRTMLQNGLLVSLPTSNGMHADPRLPENRRYCRPWTARFLADLARVHAERYHDGLQINSAVRTVEFQRHLMHINGNAAAIDGDMASPHLTGATIDIAKKGLTPSEVEWMRGYLLPLENAGKIDVEEEFHQSCFHISVYQTYSGGGTQETASGNGSLTRKAALLASRLQ